ncbi:hypothetical protein LSH36_255g04065 [Paralvinella palmiformis]|uniref:Elongation of very long chain fatty acids protein n=1 Tax=Paralvinella palmiformis TaxID=53620 RepID=A0AAD9JKH0_9ANNE|nr:hypothetical protein LSH36_255g04065 [Paralvinella palmiformis]
MPDGLAFFPEDKVQDGMAYLREHTSDGMEGLIDYINAVYVTGTFRHPRVSNWFLMSDPWRMMSIVIGYLVFVMVAPRYMANRKPYQLRLALMCYNFGLVLLSCYVLREFLATTVFEPNFKLACEPVDYSDNPSAVRLAKTVWWFFFSKVTELLDTIDDFVLLVVHQFFAYFSPMVNSFIHVLMYTYYFLSSCGPRIQKYLWWKRYITRLQLTQFFLITVQSSYTLYLDCGYPAMYMYSLVAYMISHIILFGNFYYKAYILNRHQDKQNGNDIKKPTALKHNKNQ